MQEINSQGCGIGCGIDVHRDIIVATIRKSNDEYETRTWSLHKFFDKFERMVQNRRS